jgi:hypothetical protein
MPRNTTRATSQTAPRERTGCADNADAVAFMTIGRTTRSPANQLSVGALPLEHPTWVGHRHLLDLLLGHAFLA